MLPTVVEIDLALECVQYNLCCFNKDDAQVVRTVEYEEAEGVLLGPRNPRVPRLGFLEPCNSAIRILEPREHEHEQENLGQRLYNA